MIRDKKLVADFLASKGLRAEEFSKKEKPQSKTPDFRVFNGQGQALAFYCEVKSLSKDERQGLRRDSTYDRVETKIYDAVKQFDTVNPDLVHPNVLVLVNHDKTPPIMGYVQSVVTGGDYTEGGGWLPIFKEFSEGRIKEKKLRVHLYICIDDFKGQPDFFYNMYAREYLVRLCSYFGHDPGSIPRLNLR